MINNISNSRTGPYFFTPERLQQPEMNGLYQKIERQIPETVKYLSKILQKIYADRQPIEHTGRVRLDNRESRFWPSVPETFPMKADKNGDLRSDKLDLAWQVRGTFDLRQSAARNLLAAGRPYRALAVARDVESFALVLIAKHCDLLFNINPDEATDLSADVTHMVSQYLLENARPEADLACYFEAPLNRPSLDTILNHLAYYTIQEATFLE